MWKEISPRTIRGNLIQMISEEWMLVAAGSENGCNMMTASWGFAGEMWGKDMVMIAVRPNRYTYSFLEREDYFTLSFYGDRKEIHRICGKQSGRDIDKIAATGLTPVYDHGTVYFEEARLVLVCKKLYVQDIVPECIVNDEGISGYYQDDYHRTYWGAIETALVNEN